MSFLYLNSGDSASLARLIPKSASGEYNNYQCTHSAYFEAEPRVAGCINHETRDQATCCIAHPMYEHCEQDALTGMVKEPRPDKSQGDDQTRVGCELGEIEGTIQNASWNKINRQMP